MNSLHINSGAKNVAGEQEQEMLPQDPPSKIVRWMGALLIMLFATLIAGAFVVRVPETIRCSFVIVPQAGSDPIQAQMSGKLSQVKVNEGQEIEQGAELFVLDSEEIRSAQTQFRTLSEDYRVLQEKSARLEDLYNSQVSIKNEEVKEIEDEIGFRHKHTDTARDYLSRMETLGAGGLVSQVELLRYKLDLAESEKDLNVAQKNQQQIKLQFKQLEAERVRQRREEEGELAKLRFQIESLKRQLSSCDGDTLVVRAPFRAVVLAIAHRNSGAIIQKGEELCQLARVEGCLRARLLVQETGVSHLAPGQKVRFFFDAFPYQRYGTLSGEFEWLSPAAVGSGASAQFVGRATLDRLVFETKFEKRPLRAGMRGEARVLVGKRNFIEYVFEPIKQLREQTRI